MGYVQLLGEHLEPANQATCTVTLTAAMTPGDSIIVAAKAGGGDAATGVADSQGNAYVLGAVANLGSATCDLWHCLAPGTPLGVGDTVTMTFAAAHANNAVVVEEYANVDGGADVTGTAGNLAAQTSGTVTASAPATGAGTAIAALSTGQSSGAWQETGGWNERDADSDLRIHVADIAVGAGDTPSASWSWTDARVWTSALVVFLRGAAAPLLMQENNLGLSLFDGRMRC